MTASTCSARERLAMEIPEFGWKRNGVGRTEVYQSVMVLGVSEGLSSLAVKSDPKQNWSSVSRAWLANICGALLIQPASAPHDWPHDSTRGPKTTLAFALPPSPIFTDSCTCTSEFTMCELTVDHNSRRELEILRCQYFQLIEPPQLKWPDSQTLKAANVQSWIFDNFFNSDKVAFPPPERYQQRVLKLLVSKLEVAIDNPEEDVGSTFSSLLRSASDLKDRLSVSA